jgi:Fur family transcriptional regulator, peroxide stress response regulator
MAEQKAVQKSTSGTDLKFSRQRAAILENVKGRKDHPTADMVYSSLKEAYPKISLGTVYRNLSLLSEMHEILRLHFGDGTEHYDGDISDHDHFICTRCSRIIDLFREDATGKAASSDKPGTTGRSVKGSADTDTVDTAITDAEEAWPKHKEIAKIHYRSVIYYGICTGCAADVSES